MPLVKSIRFNMRSRGARLNQPHRFRKAHSYIGGHGLSGTQPGLCGGIPGPPASTGVAPQATNKRLTTAIFRIVFMTLLLNTNLFGQWVLQEGLGPCAPRG